jgi:uncharacterized protein YndB with AHSA1/START domain
MSFTAKIQRSIHAPLSKVWDGLTRPELVKQYFFGTDLVTSWEPGTPVFFRGEWEGKPYEDKGTVLKYEHGKMLEYNYFSSWSDQEDRPENYQRITYRVKAKGNSTVLTITQSNIDTLDKKVHSAQNWAGLMTALKKLMEENQG